MSLGFLQHILFVDADLMLATAILAKALGCADVELAAQGFDGDPECFVIQPVRCLAKVEGNLVIVGPSVHDSGTSNKSSSSAFLKWSPTHRLMQPTNDIAQCFLGTLIFGTYLPF